VSGCSSCAAGVTYYSPVVQPYVSYYAYSPYVVGSSIYGAPRVYVQGEPIRNALRALTW
jgi:hypothetical protein